MIDLAGFVEHLPTVLTTSALLSPQTFNILDGMSAAISVNPIATITNAGPLLLKKNWVFSTTAFEPVSLSLSNQFPISCYVFPLFVSDRILVNLSPYPLALLNML